MRTFRRSRAGFSLVELSTTMVTSAILILTLAALLWIANTRMTALTAATALQNDVRVLNTYLDTYLWKSLADSLRIYTDNPAFEADNPSPSGTILTTVDKLGNRLRIFPLDNRLYWEKNGSAQPVLTNSLGYLQFQTDTLQSPPGLTVAVLMKHQRDSLYYERSISPRN